MAPTNSTFYYLKWIRVPMIFFLNSPNSSLLVGGTKLQFKKEPSVELFTGSKRVWLYLISHKSWGGGGALLTLCIRCYICMPNDVIRCKNNVLGFSLTHPQYHIKNQPKLIVNKKCWFDVIKQKVKKNHEILILIIDILV